MVESWGSHRGRLAFHHLREVLLGYDYVDRHFIVLLSLERLLRKVSIVLR